MPNVIPIDSNSGYPVCVNPSCKAQGKSHPHCRCWGLAKGGEVVAGHYCSEDRKHESDCVYFKDGGSVAPSFDQEGNEVSQAIDPQDTIDHSVAHGGLLGLLKKGLDLRHAERGRKSLRGHSSTLFEGRMSVDHMPKDTQALKDHLEELQEDPGQLIDLPSDPAHAAQLGSTAANAVAYFRSLRPKSEQPGPLDNPTPPDRLAQSKYDRQVSIAQNPLLVLRHMKDGTLQPSDLITLNTLYPKLAKQMVDHAGQALISAQSRGIPISRTQKQTLSLLLGKPMDFTQTPQAMQAIMQSASPQQVKRLPQEKKQKKASGSELKQINKVNEMTQTPLESRLINRNSK